MQLAAVYSIGEISGYCACCYTGNLAVCSNSYFAQLSAFIGDLAVVAACIAYEQLAVTQCGMAGEHAIFQNYVADFAFGCGYFAVFIYNQFAVGSIECTVAVYEERYSAVFICSTYGQVVFCVQCVGLNGVYINIFIQLNIGTIIADFNVLVAAEINNFAGSYIGCFGCNTVGGKIPAFICICSYLFDFFQLAYIYSISIINAFSYVSDYFIVSIQAIFGDVSIAAKTNTTFGIKEVVACIYLVNFQIFVQFNFYSVNSINSFVAYANVLITFEIDNSIIFNLFQISYSTICSELPTAFCYSAVQLAYVYSISSFSTCCYVGNYFTVSIQTALGNVSIAAKTNAHIIIHEEFTSMNAVNIKVSAKFNLNGRAKKFLCCTYDDISFVTVKVNITARLYFSSCCYTIINRQIPTFVSVIRCRIISHRRSHACTGHNTCCNQHCQQLFGRAAFTAMIFCDFGDNNICVARLTPNYFEYFVHQKFLPHK